MLGSDNIRKKEERQSNNAWFGLPWKEGIKTEEPTLGSDRLRRKKEERQSNNAWFGPP